MTRRDMARTIARNIRRVRESVPMTALALGGVVGIAPSHVSRLESGRRLPELDTLIRVARALNVPLSALLEGL